MKRKSNFNFSIINSPDLVDNYFIKTFYLAQKLERNAPPWDRYDISNPKGKRYAIAVL